jgi:hypothetical protein
MANFDTGKPEAGIAAKLLDNRVRDNNTPLQLAINNEHEFVDNSASQSGDHTQGSARCYSQSSAPANRIDGGAFKSTDLGSLWVDTDDNALYILTATTPTWTPVSTEVIATLLAANRIFAGTLGVTGDFDVNTDKFTVTASNGNTAVAGTLDITGDVAVNTNKVTIDAATGNTGIAGTLSVTGATDITGTTTHTGGVVQAVNAGTETVFTKYFTGDLNNASSTSVAHGVSSGVTNILSVTVACGDGTSLFGQTRGDAIGAAADEYAYQWNDTHVIINAVGSTYQGQAYRIKVDYK